MWGGIAAGVGNILGSWLGSRQQNRNVNKTNQANIKLANLRYANDMKMAEYGFDKNLEMWKLQNEYNSPEAQMQRFEDAGLNKHMIYGQGTPGNATGTPTFTSPSYQPPTLDYMGETSPTANTLGAFTGASKAMLEIQHKKENLEQAQVQTWIDQNAKHAKLGFQEQSYQSAFWKAKGEQFKSRIEEIKASFWEKGISPTDATWLRIGQMAIQQLDAPQWLKKLFNNLPSTIQKAIQ